MDIQPCNMIAYLAHYGYFLNRITSFVYEHINPQCCLSTNNSNFTRVESQCQTTFDTVLFALTGKFDQFRVIEPSDLTLDYVMDQLYRWNMIEINIFSNNEFGGHVLIIIRDDNIFYIIQSYIFKYKIKVYIADEKQIELYINHYLNIFNTDDHQWSKDDIDLWKCITGVNLPELNAIKPRMFISWWYSYPYPYPFSIYTKDCQHFVRNLLEEALIKIDNSDFEDIMDVFGDLPIEEIKDDIEQLLNDLDLLNYYEQIIKFGELTHDGCLIY